MRRYFHFAALGSFFAALAACNGVTSSHHADESLSSNLNSLSLTADASTPIPVTTCRDLSSGSYVLAADITTGGRNCGGSNNCCIRINGASNVSFDGGSFRMDTGVDAIRIDGASSNLTISHLHSSDGIFIYGASTSNITIQDSEFKNLTGYDTDDLTVQRNQMQQLTFDAISGGAYRLRVLDNVIYQSADPSDTIHYCASCVADVLKWSHHTVHLDSKNANLDHFIIGDWVITGNTIRSNHPLEEITKEMDPLTPSAVSAITIRDTKNVLFANNTIESVAGYGIYLRDYDQDSIYTNNIIRTVKRNALFIASGAFNHTVSNNEFSYNLIQSDRDFPLGFENPGLGNRVSGNRIVNRGGGCNGVLLSAGWNTILQNNTFLSTSSGPAVCRGSNSTTDDVFQNNIYSFFGSQAFNYTSNFSGMNNVYNSRDQQAPIHSSTESNSKDLGGNIFQSIDPSTFNFLQLYGNSAACSAGVGGTYVGPFSCIGNVRIVSPAANMKASGQVPIQLSLQMPFPIDHVEYYIDRWATNYAIASLFDAPYQFVFDTTKLVNGIHTLGVRAYDVRGAYIEEAHDIEVENVALSAQDALSASDMVILSSPKAGAYVSGQTTLKASVVLSSRIDHVEFYSDISPTFTKLIGSVSSAPYQLLWDSMSAPNGSMRLRVRAYDKNGNMIQEAHDVNIANGGSDPYDPSNDPLPELVRPKK